LLVPRQSSFQPGLHNPLHQPVVAQTELLMMPVTPPGQGLKVGHSGRFHVSGWRQSLDGWSDRTARLARVSSAASPSRRQSTNLGLLDGAGFVQKATAFEQAGVFQVGRP
jgi:hypothetical protein